MNDHAIPLLEILPRSPISEKNVVCSLANKVLHELLFLLSELKSYHFPLDHFNPAMLAYLMFLNHTKHA